MGAPRILMRSAVPSLSYALGVLQVFFIKAAFIFLNLLKVKGKCVIIVVRIKLRTAERGKESVACRLRRKSAIFFRGAHKTVFFERGKSREKRTFLKNQAGIRGAFCYHEIFTVFSLCFRDKCDIIKKM